MVLSRRKERAKTWWGKYAPQTQDLSHEGRKKNLFELGLAKSSLKKRGEGSIPLQIGKETGLSRLETHSEGFHKSSINQDS